MTVLEAAALRRLVTWLDAAGVHEFELQEGSDRLRLRFAAQAAPGRTAAASRRPPLPPPVPPPVPPAAPDVAAAVAADLAAGGGPARHDVGSAWIGIVHLRHPACDDRFAAVGDDVSAGEVLGLVEIGQAYFRPVRAPIAGRLVDVVAAHGQAVGYGTPLFRILAD